MTLKDVEANIGSQQMIEQFPSFQGPDLYDVVLLHHLHFIPETEILQDWIRTDKGQDMRSRLRHIFLSRLKPEELALVVTGLLAMWLIQDEKSWYNFLWEDSSVDDRSDEDSDHGGESTGPVSSTESVSSFESVSSLGRLRRYLFDSSDVVDEAVLLHDIADSFYSALDTLHESKSAVIKPLLTRTVVHEEVIEPNKELREYFEIRFISHKNARRLLTSKE